MSQLETRIELETIQDGARGVKQVENKLEARISGEMHTIIFERGSREAGKRQEVDGLVAHELRRETSQDLRQSVAVPDGMVPVHGGTNEEGSIRML